MPAGDIDILVKKRNEVKVFDDALACFDCLVAPTFLEDMRQYYTEYKIKGVEVGISTVEIETDKDWIETYGPGPWIHYVLLPCGSYMVPAVKLELRLITKMYRNRPERYNPIIEFLRNKGHDESLLRRGIRGIPENFQNIMLSRLSSR